MKPAQRSFGAVDRRLIPEGRMTGPMPWIIAIMMLLTVLAAAAGLALGNVTRSLGASDRVTIQIVEADPVRRETQARAVLANMAKAPQVASVRRVGDEEMQTLLGPWLGEAGLGGADLPIPALIDIEMRSATPEALASLEREARRIAPSARVDDHAQALAPVTRLVGSFLVVALLLVLLMLGATAAVVVLAARAALESHRATIEVVHLMGATDRQVAHLFQRRVALDALFGGSIGFAAALLILWVLGGRVHALGSELFGAGATFGPGWLLLALLPLLATALATLVARITILRALSRSL